jgi:hypothetical protein
VCPAKAAMRSLSSLPTAAAGVILWLKGNFFISQKVLNTKEVAMKITRFASPFIPVIAFACFALGCRSSRRLESITISQTTSATQSTFVATGTFSASPTTVTPLPVSWNVGDVAAQYTLTTQPFSSSNVCPPVDNPVADGVLIAVAPADANAPSSGSVSGTKMIQATGPFVCP